MAASTVGLVTIFAVGQVTAFVIGVVAASAVELITVWAAASAGAAGSVAEMSAVIRLVAGLQLAALKLKAA